MTQQFSIAHNGQFLEGESSVLLSKANLYQGRFYARVKAVTPYGVFDRVLYHGESWYVPGLGTLRLAGVKLPDPNRKPGSGDGSAATFLLDDSTKLPGNPGNSVYAGRPGTGKENDILLQQERVQPDMSGGEAAKLKEYLLNEVRRMIGADGFAVAETRKDMDPDPETGIFTCTAYVYEGDSIVRREKPVTILPNHSYLIDSVDADANVWLLNPHGPRNASDGGGRFRIFFSDFYRYFCSVNLMEPPGLPRDSVRAEVP